MKKRTKIILSFIMGLVVFYFILNMCIGVYQSKMATAIEYSYYNEQNIYEYSYIDYNGEEYYQLYDYYRIIIDDSTAPTDIYHIPYYYEKVNYDNFIYAKVKVVHGQLRDTINSITMLMLTFYLKKIIA